LVTYLNLPILAVALIGLSIALYDYYLAKDKSQNVVQVKEEVMSDGI